MVPCSLLWFILVWVMPKHFSTWLVVNTVTDIFWVNISVGVKCTLYILSFPYHSPRYTPLPMAEHVRPYKFKQILYQLVKFQYSANHSESCNHLQSTAFGQHFHTCLKHILLELLWQLQLLRSILIKISMAFTAMGVDSSLPVTYGVLVQVMRDIPTQSQEAVGTDLIWRCTK